MSNNKRQKAEGGKQRAAGDRNRWLSCCLLLSAFCLLFSGCRQDMQDQPRYEVYEPSKSFKDGLSSRHMVEGTVPRGFLRADTQLYTGKMSKAQGASGTTQSGNTTNQSGQEEGAGGAANATANGNTNTQAAGGSNAGTSSGAAPQGKAGEDDDATEFPFPVTAEVINRGQERYRIFCVMCHGETGAGDGMIVRRGFRQPPPYSEERLRQAPVGYFFRVITEGYGAMPPYRAQIPVQDRWAITAYIRALQLSQLNQQTAPAHGAESQPAAGGHR